MENNPVKKLSRAAAILSLTAVLSTMPVSAASGYASVGIWYADALAVGPLPSVRVELSCEIGGEGDSKSSDSTAEDASVRATISSDDVDYHRGEVLAAYAAAWSEDVLIEEDYYPR